MKPSLTFNPHVSTVTPREAYERALTIGPDHQDYPFHCLWCSVVFTAPTNFPYCSLACGVRAELDGKGVA